MPWASRALSGLAEGDLTGRLEKAFSSQFERLRADYNASAEKLDAALSAMLKLAGQYQAEDLVRIERLQCADCMCHIIAQTRKRIGPGCQIG